MSPEFWLTALDSAGLFVFAISGAIVAVRKDMDIFGVIVLSLFPAMGGGTIRDLLLGVPVFWLSDTRVLLFAIAGAITTFFAHRFLEKMRPLRWADAIGMAFFAVAGAAKAFGLGHSMAIVLIMGTITACAGGLLRDVIVNEDPLLLKTDIYASAALLGSLVYYLLISQGLSAGLSMSCGVAAAFILRGLAIIFNWSLPRAPFRN